MLLAGSVIHCWQPPQTGGVPYRAAVCPSGAAEALGRAVGTANVIANTTMHNSRPTRHMAAIVARAGGAAGTRYPTVTGM